MRRVFIGVGVAVVVLIIAFAVVKYRSADVTLEQAPCRSCAAVYASIPAIPTVQFCEFAVNQSRYANQLVRLKAIFEHDAGQTFLRPTEAECPGQTLTLKTGLDERSEACAGARKALTIYTGFETWYDSRAVVVVVGRVGRINNPKSYYHCDDGFNILCLEHVEPIGSGEWQRKNYESWRSWLLEPRNESSP